ncbi:ThuA domain-containing protein [Parapedobacter sp. 10938]|uniref:ThuA domain-containing protein n=1 Tax=Parapedobacter flavus TaxID=3110225 RepID=UPI002DB60EC7|nr:ThuA domain-containing protein [Parapedobacter sp. 10938]MEC3881048.1 ThuA domain-containing protein [Parapedobacter sp. 10938]
MKFNFLVQLTRGVLLGLSLLLCAHASFAQSVNWKKIKVLVYTKNGVGFVHDNIENSIIALKALGEQHGFSVDATEDPSVFTDANLKQYDALVFSNTNNDVFDTDAQRVALMRYIQAGGGFVGIHSASGTERNWKWFKQMLGGTFYWHDKYQPFTVNIIDAKHPSVAHLPRKWVRVKGDEFYYVKQMSVNLHVVAVNDATTLAGEDDRRSDTFGDVFPSVWCHEFDGGRAWYTSLGHSKEDYKDDEFMKHILGGLEWVVKGTKKRDYSKAYATSPDDVVRER